MRGLQLNSSVAPGSARADVSRHREAGANHRAAALATRAATSSVALAVAFAILLEATVFRDAYLLADRSTVAIVYKGRRLEQGRSEDVIILGPSTALAIDAVALEAGAGGRVSIYNYAVPNLGTPDQYYFVLKKYLRWNHPPRQIILSLPPDFLYNMDPSATDAVVGEIEAQRFRRFFGPSFLLTGVAPEERRWPSVAGAAVDLLPSFEYRTFIKNALLTTAGDDAWEREAIPSAAAIYRRNRRLVERMEATNGQLLYNEDQVVPDRWIARTIPGAPNPRSPTPARVERAIRLAASAAIPLTVAFTPVCCERNAALDTTGSWRLVVDLMRTWERRYPGFRFVQANARSYEQEYFGDDEHVNERGARRLNQEWAGSVRALVDSDALQ